MARPERCDQSPSTGTTTKHRSRLFFYGSEQAALASTSDTVQRLVAGAPAALMPLGGTTTVQLQSGKAVVVPPCATGAPAAPGVAPCLRSGNDCESGDAPVLLMTGCFGHAHLLALPNDLLIQILVLLSGLRLRAVLRKQPKTSPAARYPAGHCDLYGFTIGHALAAAGACCKAFADCVHEAATIIAGGHGWRLPVVGGALMHLSKLEQDTQRVRFFLRDRSVPCWSTAQTQFFVSWTLEIWPGFIGALLIDPQVRLQHTLELGEFLINTGMGVRSDYTTAELGERTNLVMNNKLMTVVFELLARLMAQASTPLNASWLAARVFPLIKEHMVKVPPGFYAENSEKIKKASMVRLLGYIEPSVLRSHREVFEWLQTELNRAAKEASPIGRGSLLRLVEGDTRRARG